MRRLKITRQGGEVSSQPWVSLAIRIYGLWLWLAQLSLSSSPGLIIAQSCLTSYEAASVCLAASPDRWEGKERERKSRKKERKKESRNERIR